MTKPPAARLSDAAGAHAILLLTSAYRPVVTNVLQPLEHAGEDGDTEAVDDDARRRRGRRMSGGARQRAKKRAAREEALLLSAASGGDTDGG